jgi:hypothetical protein
MIAVSRTNRNPASWGDTCPAAAAAAVDSPSAAVLPEVVREGALPREGRGLVAEGSWALLQARRQCKGGCGSYHTIVAQLITERHCTMP